MLRIPFLWDMTLPQWVFDGTECPNPQHPTDPRTTSKTYWPLRLWEGGGTMFPQNVRIQLPWCRTQPHFYENHKTPTVLLKCTHYLNPDLHSSGESLVPSIPILHYKKMKTPTPTACLVQLTGQDNQINGDAYW